MSTDWPIVCDPAAKAGQRIAQVAISALADGKLSTTSRLDFYRQFVACGGTETLIPIKGTTCAVFAGAVLHWAGRLAKLPRYPVSGPTSITSWLNGLTGGSPAWRSYGLATCIPEPGAVFYVEADSNPGSNHVGVLIVELAPGVWLTAEGGAGADGSECHFGVRRWGLGWDARRLRGLWLPAYLDHMGPPPPAPDVALPAFPIVKGDSRRDVVKRWQKRLLAAGYALPRYGADGGYGGETVTATAKLMTDHGLQGDGTSVNLETWEAAEPK